VIRVAEKQCVSSEVRYTYVGNVNRVKLPILFFVVEETDFRA
jgi:hypothetical protein